MERIGEGEGFTGRLAQFRMVYDVTEEGAPPSLVAKFPTADPHVRAILNRRGIYEREIRFYQEVAQAGGLRTPRAYYGAFDHATGESVLLLEDLVHARVGDNITGCSPEEVECVIRHLATFHATWWEHPRLVQLDWMPFFHDDADGIQELYQQLWSTFVAKFSELLPGAFLEIGARFRPHVAHSRHQLAGPPHTIVHGDFRLDNCLFGPAESDTALTVIDWQVALRGRGVSDVAYFLAFCVPPSQRRALEKSCLQTYHTILGTNGVRGYEFAQCLQDYRLSLLQVLARLVTAGALLDFTSDRGQAPAEALIQRCAAALEDHNIGALLPA
jgi:thiamine kinase-like enzyme